MTIWVLGNIWQFFVTLSMISFAFSQKNKIPFERLTIFTESDPPARLIALRSNSEVHLSDRNFKRITLL